MAKLGSVAALVVAAGTAVCGLLMLGGVGPNPAGAETSEAPLAPSLDDLPSLQVVPDESSTSTSTSSTTTTIATTTSSVPESASPVPLSVSPSSVTVGVGGVAEISGQCPTVGGVPAGPVVIWEIGDTIKQIATGVTAAAWSYQWTAPIEVGPLVLQAWCGDPTGFSEGYPADLQVEVVFVAQEQPTATTTTTTIARVIPETD